MDFCPFPWEALMIQTRQYELALMLQHFWKEVGALNDIQYVEFVYHTNILHITYFHLCYKYLFKLYDI